jgi:hypothetical protein
MAERKPSDDKAAFGVYPQMKGKRSKQDPEAAKNVPVDLARGFVAGTLGMPGDIESLVRMLPGLDEKTFLPTSEDIEKRLPFRSDAPVSRAASGLGILGGGFYTGPGSAARAITAVPSAVKRAGLDFATAAGQPAANVVKPKGGNFLTGSVERDLKPLKRPMNPDEVAEVEAHLAKIEPHYNLNDPRDVRQLADMRAHIQALKQNEAINNWVDRNLGNYVKKEMGTPEDPVRRLAEQGITHKADLADYEGIYPDRTLLDQRKAAGFPEEGLGQSPLAKAWERASDESIAPYSVAEIQGAPEQAARLQAAKEQMMTARDALDGKLFEHIISRGLSENDASNLVKNMPYDQKALMIGDTDFMQANAEYLALHSPMSESFLRMAQENPWIAKLDPNSSVYSPFSGDLGFDHIMDVLREDLASGRIRPEQLSKVSMEQAVRRTAEYDQELAAKMNAARAAQREGLPVYKEYPEGYRWVELNKPGAFASESEAMGHSVRGYEPPQGHPDWVAGSGDRGSLGYGHGGWEAIKSGKAKVYSLVDSKGAPHTTVEVSRNQMPFWEDVKKHLAAAEEEAKKLPNGYTEDDIEKIANRMARNEMPPQITQIKGKSNRAPNPEYLPFVQDFVKSGEWSDVGDIGNTGLRNVSNWVNPDTAKEYEKFNLSVPKYATDEELDALHRQYEALSKPEGMKRGGVVISNNPDTMMLEVNNHKMAGGGLLKGLKAAAKAVKEAPKPVKGTQEVLPAAEREANKAKFLEPSAVKGRLYHGTHPWEKDGKQLGDVKEFNRNASVDIVGRRPSIDTVGTWMSTNPGEGGAEMYGSAIYPLHAQIKNPYSTTFDQMLKRARLLENGKDDGRRVGEEEVTALREWLKSTGYDGIQIKHNPQSMSSEFKDQDAWIALEPAQIKSAIGNRGTYDIEDPDITKAEGGAIHMKGGGAEDDTKPYFGGAATKKYAAAKKRAEQADVNLLPDPKTYAAVSGLLGTAPDEMGFSVLRPDYQAIREVAEPAFYTGTALGIAPLAKALNAPLAAAGKALEPAAGRFVTKTMERGGLGADILRDMGQGARSYAYLPHTPGKPDPTVGSRYKTQSVGNLAPKRDFDIQAEKGSSVMSNPWDSTSRGEKVLEVSDTPLVDPFVTEGGQDFARDLGNIKANIGGASGRQIAERMQDRVNDAYFANMLDKGTGRIFTMPSTMEVTGSNYSTMPTDIIMDFFKQAELPPKYVDRVTDDLRSFVFEEERGKFKNAAKVGSPEFMKQLREGGEGFSAGDLRKGLMNRMSKAEYQKLLGYNIEDVYGAIHDPTLKDLPKGFVGNTMIETSPFASVGPSTHQSYNASNAGKYAGSMPSMPIELMMPDLYQAMEINYLKSPKYQSLTPSQLRTMIINTIEKRGSVISQPINDRVIDNAMRYQEGLKQGHFNPKDYNSIMEFMRRTGGYKKGGAVKVKPQVKKAEGGAIDYDTTPDMSDGGRIIEGAPFKHGGKVKMTANRDAMFLELSNKKLKRK